MPESPASSDRPKISVITVSYNSASTIADTLQSVGSQEYENYEHIVVDGSSTDGTLEVVKNFSSGRTKVSSEPDAGIYDAMNKGIGMASGEVVGFLNADDYFAHPRVLSLIGEAFQSSEVQAFYSDIDLVDPRDTSRVTRAWKSGSFKPRKLSMGWHPPHPSFYLRRALLSSEQAFDCSYKIAADYELMIRLMKRMSPSQTHYERSVLVKMREMGVSNSSFAQILKANLECMRASHKAGFKTSFLIPFLKPASKIFQKIRPHV